MTPDYGSAAYNHGRTFVGASCTLNGTRAIIIGRSLDHAIVATLPDGPSYEWSWSAVARIMEAGGTFRA